MPYINKEKRQYNDLINSAILTIVRNNMPPMVRAEYFGYFVARVCEHYMNAMPATNMFNSSTFDKGYKKQIEDLATKVGAVIGSEQPIMSVGNLNYIITSVWWGICGEHPEVEEVNYGFRCFTRGVIEQFLSTLNSTRFSQTGSSGDVMNLRRAVAVRGVLNDVISECYRRKTAEYEDTKIVENGDIWNDGALVTA
jgi:hypothetical protein